ncbi:hypothetical protein BJ741DRAFT_239121 [Chytriomyces cf. hyalinus JEL632]|nr:hypothetical protein BJ741DRAFT_239121 [Chytriomyces cf. hyalinus JEL632]
MPKKWDQPATTTPTHYHFRNQFNRVLQNGIDRLTNVLIGAVDRVAGVAEVGIDKFLRSMDMNADKILVHLDHRIGEVIAVVDRRTGDILHLVDARAGLVLQAMDQARLRILDRVDTVIKMTDAHAGHLFGRIDGHASQLTNVLNSRTGHALCVIEKQSNRLIDVVDYRSGDLIKCIDSSTKTLVKVFNDSVVDVIRTLDNHGSHALRITDSAVARIHGSTNEVIKVLDRNAGDVIKVIDVNTHDFLHAVNANCGELIRRVDINLLALNSSVREVAAATSRLLNVVSTTLQISLSIGIFTILSLLQLLAYHIVGINGVIALAVCSVPVLWHVSQLLSQIQPVENTKELNELLGTSLNAFITSLLINDCYVLASWDQVTESHVTQVQITTGVRFVSTNHPYARVGDAFLTKEMVDTYNAIAGNVPTLKTWQELLANDVAQFWQALAIIQSEATTTHDVLTGHLVRGIQSLTGIGMPGMTLFADGEEAYAIVEQRILTKTMVDRLLKIAAVSRLEAAQTVHVQKAATVQVSKGKWKMMFNPVIWVVVWAFSTFVFHCISLLNLSVYFGRSPDLKNTIG